MDLTKTDNTNHTDNTKFTWVKNIDQKIFKSVSFELCGIEIQKLIACDKCNYAIEKEKRVDLLLGEPN